MSGALLEQLEQARSQLTAPGAPFEIAECEVRGQRMKAFRNAPRDVIALIGQGRAFAEREFLVYCGERWSYARFFAEVDALAAQLQARLGVGRGDRVAIAMRNRPEWMTAFAAAMSVGAIAVPLNSWGQREELLHGLRDSGPKILFCDGPRLAFVADDLAALSVTPVVTEASDGVGALRYSALLEGAGTPAPVQVDPDDAALILYTSGTTSHPKGVVTTHRAICQTLVNFDFVSAVAGMTSAESVKAIMAAGFAPTLLSAVPLFHVSGLQAQFLNSVRLGRRMVLMYKWDAAEALRLIASERVTAFNGSPAMMAQLLSAPGFATTDTSSLSGLGLGGSSVPHRTLELIHTAKPLAMAGIGYGLTETGGVGTSCTGAAFRHKPTSSGQVSPICDIAIVAPDGTFLPRGVRGEIRLRGVTVMSGYWRNPQTTAETLKDGWFASGDVGYLDQDGFLHVVDRIKDIVIRGGENISTAEVESCALQHQAVAEAAAFGVPDAVMGEALVLVVRLRDGEAADEDGLRRHLARQLAHYKLPAHIRLTHAELPRNPAGKLLKQALREQALQQPAG